MHLLAASYKLLLEVKITSLFTTISVYFNIKVFTSYSLIKTVGLVRIPFFELRSFGSNQHRIFEASEGGAEHILLSDKSRTLCASVCLIAFLFVENRSSNDFTRGGCVAADPRECSVAYGCNMDTQHVQN